MDEQMDGWMDGWQLNLGYCSPELSQERLAKWAIHCFVNLNTKLCQIFSSFKIFEHFI
jgi:hypothetical protein